MPPVDPEKVAYIFFLKNWCFINGRECICQLKISFSPISAHSYSTINGSVNKTLVNNVHAIKREKRQETRPSAQLSSLMKTRDTGETEGCPAWEQGAGKPEGNSRQNWKPVLLLRVFVVMGVS